MKQREDIQNGERTSISTTKILTDAVISGATSVWGEGAEIAAKTYLQNEFKSATKGVIATATEFQENSYQQITTATISENNTPKNQPAPPLQYQQNNQSSTSSKKITPTGNRMENPQPVFHPTNF